MASGEGAATSRDRFAFAISTDNGAAGSATRRMGSSRSPKGRPKKFHPDLDTLGFSDEDTGLDSPVATVEEEPVIANNPAQSAEFMQALLGRMATGMKGTSKKKKTSSFADDTLVSWDAFGKGMPVPGKKGKKGCSVAEEEEDLPDFSTPFNEEELPNLLLDDDEAGGPGGEDGEEYNPFFRIRSPSRSCSRTASAGSRSSKLSRKSTDFEDQKVGYKEFSFGGGDAADDGEEEEVADPEAALAALGLGPPRSTAARTLDSPGISSSPGPASPPFRSSGKPQSPMSPPSRGDKPASPSSLAEKLRFSLGAGSLDDDDEETADIDEEAGPPEVPTDPNPSAPTGAHSPPRNNFQTSTLIQALNTAAEAQAAGASSPGPAGAESPGLEMEAGVELPEEPGAFEEEEVSELEKQMAEQVCGVVNSIAVALRSVMNGKINGSQSMNESVRHLMMAVDVNVQTKYSLGRLEVLTRLIGGVGINTPEYQQGLRTMGRILKEVVVHFMQVMRGIHTDYLQQFWELFSLLDAESEALISLTELDPKFNETKEILQKELPELVKDVQQAGKVLKWPRSGRWAYGMDMME